MVIRVLGQDSAQQALDRSVYDDSCFGQDTALL